MQKVVIDTSIIISALYSPLGKPAAVLKLARKRKVINIISPHILNEVEEVLKKKLSWPNKETRRTIKWLKNFSRLVNPKTKINIIDYQPDNEIIACAIQGKANIIVTGDKKHLLKLKQYQNISIISADEFLKKYS